MYSQASMLFASISTSVRYDGPVKASATPEAEAVAGCEMTMVPAPALTDRTVVPPGMPEPVTASPASINEMLAMLLIVWPPLTVVPVVLPPV